MVAEVKTSGRQPIHEQVIQLRAAALTRREAPVEVMFSQEGYKRAMAETSGTDLSRWGMSTGQQHWTSYMGYPFQVLGGGEDVSLRCVPGGSQEAKDFRAGKRSVDQEHPGRQTPHGYHATRAKMMVDDQATLELMGKAANAAQVCDFIRAFLDADDATHWGDFEKALDRVVVQHGRFE